MGANAFLGESIVIDSISIFVLLLISFFSFKYYQIKKNWHNLNLAIGLLLLAFAFLMEIFINIATEINLFNLANLGYGQLDFNSLRSPNSLAFLLFFLYHAVNLAGFFMFYTVYERQSWPNVILYSYLMCIVLIFSHFTEVIFYINSFIILLLITLQAFRRLKLKSYPTTRFLVYSFAIITASQVPRMLMIWDAKFFLMGEIIQLIGYMSLLVTFIAVIVYGRKKVENRYHW